MVFLSFFIVLILISCGDETAPLEKNEWGKGVPVPMYNDFEDENINPVSLRMKQYFSEIEDRNIIYSVNVTDYGIAPNSEDDASSAIRRAIQDARTKFGGGVVFIPAGQYNLRDRIVLEPNISLRGEWVTPTEDTISSGTILNVYVDRGKDGDDSPFISTADGSTVSNLTIYYPSQYEDDPVSYPYTIANKGYLGVEIKNMTLVNSYNGIKIDDHNWLFFRDIYMTALNIGFRNNGIYDIGKWENVKISPKYWGMYERSIGKENAVLDADVRNFTLNNTTGVSVGRYDWIYMYKTSMEGLKRGIDVRGIFNGILYEVDIHDSIYPLFVSGMSDIGTQITNSRFSAVTKDGISAYFTSDIYEDGISSSYEAYTMMYNVLLESDGRAIVMDTNGMVSIMHSTITKWDKEKYAFEINRGVLIADDNIFIQENKHINIGSKVIVSKITGNGSLDILNKADDNFDIIIDENKHENSTDKLHVDLIDVEKRFSKKDDMFYAPDYGVSVDNQDNTKQLQHALLDAHNNGGGIVLLPGGDFKFDGYLVIPPGVELKGVNDSAKHYGSPGKGTVLVTNYGKNKLKATPFLNISNEAGINGFSIFYPDQSFDNAIPFADTVYVPGNNAWVYNVTVVNGYNAMRFKGDNFHVDFARGYSIKDFFIVDRVDGGFINNVLVTIGDWQDARVTNGPGPDAWKRHPNLDGTRAFYIKDSNNIQLIQNFAFGFDIGLEIVGEVNNLVSYGTGIDASTNALILRNSGKNNVFINSELVCTENYVWTTKEFSGSVDLINTNNWMQKVGNTTIDGTGNVRMSMFKQMTGEVYLTGGNIILEQAIIHSNIAKIIISKNVTGGLVLNPVGNKTFLDVENNSKIKVLYNSRGK